MRAAGADVDVVPRNATFHRNFGKGCFTCSSHPTAKRNGRQLPDRPSNGTAY